MERIMVIEVLDHVGRGRMPAVFVLITQSQFR